MVAEVAGEISELQADSAGPGAARSRPRSQTLEDLIARFNQAVRRPETHGGVSVLPLLLDLIAEASQQTEDSVWIPDAVERLSAAPIVREHFTDPDIHVTASQYGEDAYRRGWLDLDRTLSDADHAALLDRAAVWAGTDRTLRDVLNEFGQASITFGNPEPHLPKTLGYATAHRDAPFVSFHFATAAGESVGTPEPTTHADAALLAVRGVHGGFLGLQLTPFGRVVCWPDKAPAHDF